MEIYICDYIDYTVSSVESFVIEADSQEDAEKQAIDHLKTLHIPKRYLIKVEKVL